MEAWTTALLVVSLLTLLWRAHQVRVHVAAVAELRSQVDAYKPARLSQLAGKSILAIVNPYGGKRIAPHILQDVLRPMCNMAGITVDVVSTEHKGHARTIAQTLDAQKYAVIVCVSGDGVLHELLNGLAESNAATSLTETLQKTPLSIIPGGSCNAVATSMTSRDAFRAVKSLIESGPQCIDLLTMQSASGVQVWDALSVSWAIVAENDALTERGLGRWMEPRLRSLYGPICVIARARTHGGRCFILPEPVLTECRVAGGLSDPSKLLAVPRPAMAQGDTRNNEKWYLIEDDTFIMFTAVNVKHGGHDVLFAPTLRHDAGALDLLVMRGTSRLGLLRTFLALETGAHVRMPEVEIFRVSQFVLEPTRSSGSLSLSGEEYPLEPICVTCHHKAGVIWTTMEAIAED